MARHPSPVVAKLNFASNSASCRRALSFALSCRRRPARRRRLSVGLSAIRCNIVCCCLPAPFDRRPRLLCLVPLRPGGGLLRRMAVLPRCFAELVRVVAAKTSGSARQAAPRKKASGRVPRLSALCNRAAWWLPFALHGGSAVGCPFLSNALNNQEHRRYCCLRRCLLRPGGRVHLRRRPYAS